MRIQKITSRLILNSQGKKAIECTIELDNGSNGAFAPPAGTSVGKYEAKTVSVEVAQEQIKSATANILQIANINQQTLDQYLNSKSELGANTTLALSIAFAIANNTLELNKNDMKRSTFHKIHKNFSTSTDVLPDVTSSGLKMPKLMVLFFEGGVHASSKVKIQEYMIVYDDILQAAKNYHEIKNQLEKDGHFVNCGMEGGMVSEKLTDEDVLITLLKGKDIALDIGGHYLPGKITLDDLLHKTPGVLSVEDPFPEDDIDSWKHFFAKWHDQLLIVGDDLTVTNKERIKQFANNAINAVIVKPNQQRTLTDTLEAVEVAKKEGLKVIVSHRSGETNQTFVSDLAVAIRANFVKFGAPVRGERVAKYNRLSYLIDKQQETI